MREETLKAFRTLQPLIRHDWEKRLRLQPVHSPLGLPDSLVHMMAWTLESVYEVLRTGRRRGGPQDASTDWDCHCRCGANPLIGYFIAAKESCGAVLMESCPDLHEMSQGEKNSRAVEISRAIDLVASREIMTFCAVCQQTERAVPLSSEIQMVESATDAKVV